MHTAYSSSLSQEDLPVKQLWPNGEVSGIHRSIFSITTKTLSWKELQTANLISYAFIQFTWQKPPKYYTEF